MQNLLILYNPYYQADVIDSHLATLREHSKVAFGKIKSKQKTMEQEFQSELDKIYQNTNLKHFTQLFLSDYANLFVAKVIEVSDNVESKIIPSYYKEKNLEVEKWFIISDMREIVRNNFEVIRDSFLAQITTANNHRTYSIYGNNYVYPLIIEQKIPTNYFSDSIYYKNIYKSEEYLRTKENLTQFNFGELINFMTPDSLDNIISAEIEYQQNKQDKLYDFSPVIVKYSKTMEKELYLMFYALFKTLCDFSPKLLDISYSVQGKSFTLKDFFYNKPNLGTYGFLLRNEKVKEALDSLPKPVQISLHIILNFIQTLKALRNENIHGKSASLAEVTELRSQVIGVKKASMLALTLEIKQML